MKRDWVVFVPFGGRWVVTTDSYGVQRLLDMLAKGIGHREPVIAWRTDHSESFFVERDDRPAADHAVKETTYEDAVDLGLVSTTYLAEVASRRQLPESS